MSFVAMDAPAEYHRGRRDVYEDWSVDADYMRHARVVHQRVNGTRFSVSIPEEEFVRRHDVIVDKALGYIKDMVEGRIMGTHYAIMDARPAHIEALDRWAKEDERELQEAAEFELLEADPVRGAW